MSRSFTNPVARSLYSSPNRLASQSTQTPPKGTTSSAPTTPTSQYPSPLPRTPLSAAQMPTGKWEHPAVSKISQLHSQRAPNETTLSRILVNVAALFVVYKLQPYISGIEIIRNVVGLEYLRWTFLAVYSLFVYNCFENARRFWWTNAYDDPTLSAAQRKLLNLPASPASSSIPPTAAITPPRYQKSFTPSPATQPSPLSGRRSSFSTSSPSNRLIGTGAHEPGRSSPMNTNSPKGRSVSLWSSSATLAAKSGFSPVSGASNPSSTDFSGSTKWKYSQGLQ